MKPLTKNFIRKQVYSSKYKAFLYSKTQKTALYCTQNNTSILIGQMALTNRLTSSLSGLVILFWAIDVAAWITPEMGWDGDSLTEGGVTDIVCIPRV